MRYRVKVRKNGAVETRVIEADSHFDVYKELEKDGAVALVLTEVGSGFALQKFLHLTIGTGVKRQQVIVMTKNLSAMLSAGLSLSRALSVLERQAGKTHFAQILNEIGASIKRGSSFHEALAKYPNIFSALFVAMVKAGEESGSLSQALLSVGVQMERVQALIRKIRGAMIYPSIVITAVVIVAVLMLIFVVPTLTKTFTELHAQVPLATRIIVAISNFMANNVVLVFALLIALFAGVVLFVRSKRGKTILLSLALYLPAIGDLVRETYAARTARTLSSLLSAGVPIVRGLTITREVIGSNAFGAVIKEAEARVLKGDPVAGAFAEHPKLYPLLMTDMLSVGEETGKIAEMLGQVADFYEGDVEERTKDLSAVIEPVLVLVIGAAVGVFAVAMIAPIYSLSGVIGS